MLLVRMLLGSLIIVIISVVLLADHRLNSDVGFTVVLATILMLGVHELMGLYRKRDYTAFSVVGTAAAGVLVVAGWAEHHQLAAAPWVPAAAFAFVVTCFLCQWFITPRPAGVVSISLTIFAVTYVWGLGSFIQRIRYLEGDGLPAVVLFLMAVKLSDIGGYFAGRYLGRVHPFKVSPKKSLEGYVGSLVLTAVAGVLVGHWVFPERSWHYWLVFSAVVWFFGGLGDLLESLLKRDLGAKDSARFPGLGGVLDMIDSVLLAAPPVYLMLRHLSG